MSGMYCKLRTYDKISKHSATSLDLYREEHDGNHCKENI